VDGPEDITNQPEEDFDWEQWPEKRAELVQSLNGMKAQFAGIDGPEMEPVLNAAKRFMSDMENVLSAGDAEYRRLHPGAQFDPS
jgi:hypothetical protein